MKHLLLGVSILWLALGLVPVQAQGKPDFQVVLVGTGTPPPLMRRFGAGTLVTAGGKMFLFDAGRGVTQRMWQKKIKFGKLDALLLTHLHSDHVIGLPDLWLTGWLPGPFGRRKHPLQVMGPEGTVNLTSNLEKAYSWDVQTRIKDQKLSPAGAKLSGRNIGPGVVYDKDGVKITAFATNHGELIKPTLGYRVDFDGRAVVISGDTLYSENLIANAKNVDLLVHSIGAARPELLASAPIWGRILAHHISPEDVGRVFSKTKPKMAVFTHVIALTNGKIKPVFPPQMVKRTRTTYSGPLVVGKDLMTITIAKDGVHVAEHKKK